MQEEIYCYHCKKKFYLNNFRFRNAKTVSCLHCGKRIVKHLTSNSNKMNQDAKGKNACALHIKGVGVPHSSQVLDSQSKTKEKDKSGN